MCYHINVRKGMIVMEKIGFRNRVINRWKIYVPVFAGIFVFLLTLLFFLKEDVKRDRAYTNKKDVALYIKKYHELPKNYITKDGKDYYYNHNINLSNYIVGGDTHYNDGELGSYNISNSVMLKECDIIFEGYSCTSNRGVNRLVYETNVSKPRVFFTNDHYVTYDEITSFEIMPVYYVLLIMTILYGCATIVFFSIIYIPKIMKISRKKDNNETKE